MSATSREKRIDRRFLREFLASMVVYTVVILVSFRLIEQTEVVWQRWLLAVLPVIPLLFALRALVRHLGRIDEFQQRLQLQAFAISAGATGIVTFTLGLLENVGMPQVSLVWVLPMIIAFWGITNILLSRRYR